MAIYILTDSTADFLPDEAQRRGIWVVPLKVQFGSETYADGLELDHAAFFRKLETAKERAHGLGVGTGIDPFMTLSFMALPVIPSLRITTRGVFDVNSQSYV